MAITVDGYGDSFDIVEIPWGPSAEDGTTTVEVGKLYGTIMRVDAIPGSAANQPTDQYDATLTDASGVDVFQGAAADLPNGSVKTFWPSISDQNGNGMPIVVGGNHSLNVSAAGEGKGGKFMIWIKP